MKIKKGSPMFSTMSPSLSTTHELIPWIDKFMIEHPYAGKYVVNDEQYVSHSKDRRHTHYHPSGDCLKCQRLLYYERDESAPVIEMPVDAHLQKIFKMGDAVHAMLQAWFMAWNEIDGYPHCVGNEVRVDSNKLGIGGFIDSVIRFPGAEQDTVIELKTINDYGFQHLNGPKPEHRMQMACYMAVQQLPEAIILYVDKNTCDMKEFRIEPIDMQSTIMRWRQVENALDAGDIDSLPYGCKRGSREWGRCPAKDFCTTCE